MKKIKLFISSIFLLNTISAYAQTPDLINYQAALRNNDGTILVGTAVSVRFSIIEASISGTEIYLEEHNTATNEYGLINLKIGGGNQLFGDFASIDWSSHNKFLKIEVKQGSGNYFDFGTQQMISVPYSLHAKNTSRIGGVDIDNTLPTAGQILKFDGTAWKPAAENNSSLPTGVAGGDLSGNYPNPTIGNNKVTTATIVNNAVTSEKIINNAITNSKIADNAVNTSKITNASITAAKLHQMGATSGQVLKWTGTAWAPAVDDNNNHFVLLGDTLIRNQGSRLNLGFNTSMASGIYATAMGRNSVASGYSSTATGNNTLASGQHSTAMGFNSIASGSNSTALGQNSTSSGLVSIAMGFNAVASSQDAVAIGNYITASGLSSFAMGSRVSTNNSEGSFVLGDYKSTSGDLNATANNQMSMRFRGGYRLFTNLAATTGVSLAAGGNSWASISDSTKKENFLIANGEAFLDKISSMKLGSWNYKGTEVATHRHYGPMAQEFYALFGNDGIGTIGNDTTIASADIDGVMMIAIQELVLENKKLKEQIDVLKKSNTQLASTTEKLVETQQETLLLLRQLQSKMEIHEDKNILSHSSNNTNAIKR